MSEKEKRTPNPPDAEDKFVHVNAAADTSPTIPVRPPPFAGDIADDVDLSSTTVHHKNHFVPKSKRSMDDAEGEDKVENFLFVATNDVEGDCNHFSDFPNDDESYESYETFYGVETMSIIWEESSQDLRSVSTRRTSWSSRRMGRTVGEDNDIESPRRGGRRKSITEENLEDPSSPLLVFLGDQSSPLLVYPDDMDKISSPNANGTGNACRTSADGISPKRASANAATTTAASPQKRGRKSPSSLLSRFGDAISIPTLDLVGNGDDDVTAVKKNSQETLMKIEDNRPQATAVVAAAISIPLLGETRLGLASKQRLTPPPPSSPAVTRRGGLTSYFQREDSFRQEQQQQQREEELQKKESNDDDHDDDGDVVVDDDEYTFVTVTTDGEYTLLSEYTYYEEET